MGVKVWDKNDAPQSYVESVYYRIVSDLPVISGLSVIEVETDQFFNKCRDALIEVVDTIYFPEVINCTCDVLDDLNKHDKYMPLSERPKVSLRSIAIILRLLSDLCEIRWKLKEPGPVSYLKRPVSSNVLTSVTGVGASSYRVNYYTTLPDPLGETVARRALSVVARLKSPRETMMAIAELQHKPYHEATSPNDTLIENIDINCASILRFISASNPVEVLNFMQAKIAVLCTQGSGKGDYVPYMDLLCHLQVIDQWLIKYAQAVLQSVDKVRKTIHLQMILYCCSKSTRFWLMSNPKNFINNIKHESSLPLLANSLFDALHSRLPDFLYAKGTSLLATILLVLSPRTFEDYMDSLSSNTARLKQAASSSKQLLFLKSIVKQVTTRGPLMSECTNCMVTIMSLAGSVREHDPTSAMFKFCALYAKDVFDTLSMADATKYCVGSDAAIIDELRVEFFVGSVTLLEDEYVNKYIEMIKDPEASLPNLRILTGGLRALSSNPRARHPFNKILKGCAPELRELLLKACDVMKSYDVEKISSPSTPIAEKVKEETVALSLTESKSSSNSDTTSLRSPTATTIASSSPQDKGAQLRNNKKESLSSFRINRHKLDMKKHMSFKLNNNSNSNSNSSVNTPTGSNPGSSPPSQTSVPQYLSTKEPSTNSIPSRNQSHRQDGTTSSQFFAFDFSYLIPEYYKDILKNLFAIFRSQPIVYLLPEEYDIDNLGETLRHMDSYTKIRAVMAPFITPFIYLYASEDQEMVESLSHFSLGIVERLSRAPTAQLALFYSFSCVIIMASLASLIADHLLDELTTKKLWSIVTLFMEARHKALEELPTEYLSESLAMHNPTICYQTFAQAERAFMSGIIIPDLETFRVVKRAVQLILADQTQEHDEECFADMNIDFFKSIALDKSTITTLTAIQKFVKKSFYKKVKPTHGFTQIWFDLYEKWSCSKDADRRSYYIGFIVAMSGVLIDSSNKDEQIRENAIAKLKYLIKNQMDLLDSDDVKVREIAKDILSAEMHPVCYKYVIEAMLVKTKAMENVESLSERDFVFVDQAMSISRILLRTDTESIYEQISDLFEAGWIWSRIIERATDELIICKLKLRHIKLSQAIDARKTELGLWGHLKAKNALARMYLDWLDTMLFKRNDNESVHAKVISVASDTTNARPNTTRKTKELEMLSFDVQIECAVALGSLLERLPLETPQAIHAKELRRSKKVIFGNYFSVLYKILDKFNSTNSVLDSSLVAKHKIALLVESAVLALTNLLDSNVDVGFEFALPLLFHEDLKIKLSFMKVFVNIVDKLDYGDEAVDQKSQAVKKVISVVMNCPALTLAVASHCPPSEVDSLAITFLNGDDNQSTVLNVLASLIKAEIFTAKNSSEILRSNSVATRMLALFCKKEGFHYLERTLKPVLTKIADQNDNFEVEKLTPDSPNAEENVEKLMFYLNEIVNALFRSIEYIPNEFKFLCSIIYEATGKVFPDAKIYAVGAFMFLRLIAPAIVRPDANDIIQVSTDRALMRSYIQLAKVLQLMANSSITTIRWPLLVSRMNELTILNVQITRFLQAVSKFNPKQDLIREDNKSAPVDSTILHHLLYNGGSKIRAAFISECTLPLHEKIEIYGQLDQALCEAGQPSSLFGYTISDFVSDKEDPDSALYEFMTKSSMKKVNFNLRDNIVHETISSDGVPTVVMNYSILQHTSFEDAEAILYRFYQVASKIWDSKFYIVCDCSGFDSAIDFNDNILKLFEAYTPPIVFKNMARIYYYNISQKYFPAIMYSLKFMQEHNYGDIVHFASGFDRNKFGFGMCPSTNAIENDARVTFYDVSLYEASQNRFVPVTIRIGDEYLQIGFRQQTRFKIFNSMKVLTLTDIYRISDLAGAEISNITGVPDEICIKDAATGSDLILASPKKIEIMRTIYFSKSRYSAIAQRQKDLEGEDEDHPEVWLGQLINIDFVGLLSHHEEVRKLSYLLLCSLAKSYKLDLGTHFESSSHVSFPQNNVTFVISAANSLAEKHKEYTYEIVNGFFNAYNNCEKYQRISAVMYIAPFIKHLFSAIDNEAESRREEKVSALIKKFIQVSTLREGSLVAFHAHVWSQLTLQDKVAEILISEAVAAAIDREAEGREWDDIISLVTLTPTLKICSTVVGRLRELSIIPKMTSSNSIATHTSWIEITVLAKICVSLFFDSALFAEMFMPDVIFIATMFIDVGPYTLRTSLYKLLLNVFHSVLAADNLEPEMREKANIIVDRFKDQRIRLALGLNREEIRSTVVQTDANIVNRITALEVMSDSLFEFIHVVGDIEMANVWRSRWHSFAVDAAFNDDSMLQDRAFLILGFLSKHGITDLLIYKLVEKISKFLEADDENSFTRNLCCVYTLSRAVQGIPPRSPYSEKFYWIAITMNYNDNLLLAHAAIQLLGNALVAVDKRGKFTNGEVIQAIFKTRSIFSNCLEEYERAYNIILTPENIDIVIVSYIIRDLESPFTKSVAVEALVNAFTVRVNNALLREKITGEASDRRCLIYALILFVISRNNDEFLGYICSTQLDTTQMVTMNEGIVVHKRLINFLLAASDQAILVLMKAASFINSGASDESSQLRFLVLYKYLAERSEKIKWMMYPVVRPSLRYLSIHTTSTVLASVVFDAARAVIKNVDHYEHLSDYEAQLNALVEKHHLEGVRDIHFSNTHPFKGADKGAITRGIVPERVKYIKQMFTKILESVPIED